jgi:hypothetical protein
MAIHNHSSDHATIAFAIDQAVIDELPGLVVRVDTSFDDPLQDVRAHIDAPLSNPTKRVSHRFSRTALMDGADRGGASMLMRVLRDGVHAAIKHLRAAVPDLADQCAKVLWEQLCAERAMHAATKHRANMAEMRAVGWEQHAMAATAVMLGHAIRAFAEEHDCLHDTCEFCGACANRYIVGEDDTYPWCGECEPPKEAP